MAFISHLYYRELECNSSQHGYRPDWASQQSLMRRQQRPTKIGSNPELKQFLINKLKEGWSPDAISGHLKRQGQFCLVSCETIYRYIYSPEGIKLKLYQHLQQKRRYRYPRIKRRRRTIMNNNKLAIKVRDETINQRESFGHWEGDLVLFRKTQTNLFTLRERKSRWIAAIKNPSRKAKTTTTTLIKYMKNKFDHAMNTLTLDNDPAFALHEDIRKAYGTTVYFCEPYKSYQKGAIENANKLIRTQLPRQTNINALGQQQLDNIVKKLNDRPMRCLDYQTPNEVFLQAFG